MLHRAGPVFTLTALALLAAASTIALDHLVLTGQPFAASAVFSGSNLTWSLAGPAAAFFVFFTMYFSGHRILSRKIPAQAEKKYKKICGNYKFTSRHRSNDGESVEVTGEIYIKLKEGFPVISGIFSDTSGINKHWSSTYIMPNDKGVAYIFEVSDHDSGPANKIKGYTDLQTVANAKNKLVGDWVIFGASGSGTIECIRL